MRCHVDACFGGWVLPYLRRLGVAVPPFDFAVPGVTSVSVDLHKYAYCPKGVSVLLHRDEALRAPQYFAYADWPGLHDGEPDDRLDPIRRADRGRVRDPAPPRRRRLPAAGRRRRWTAVRGLAAAVVPRGRACGCWREPESTVVVFTSDDPALDLFVLADELTARGWHTQPQLAYADLPPLDPPHGDRRRSRRRSPSSGRPAEAAAAARALGPAWLPTDLVAFVGALDPGQLDPDPVASLAAGLGLGARRRPLPDRQAVINTLLEAAPVPVREALFAAFLRPAAAPDLLARSGAAGSVEPVSERALPSGSRNHATGLRREPSRRRLSSWFMPS